MVIVSHTMRAAVFMPFQSLGSGQMSLTIHAPVSFRAIAQIGRLPKHRQMSYNHPLILPVQFPKLSSTFATDAPSLHALDGDDQLPGCVHLRLQ
jgi:hypothetical protein